MDVSGHRIIRQLTFRRLLLQLCYCMAVACPMTDLCRRCRQLSVLSAFLCNIVQSFYPPQRRIIIAFKGSIRDVLQSLHSAANCLQHVRSSGLGAIVCKSCATHRALITCKCHVTCHLVRRDSSAIKFDRVEITFIWALFYWLNH